MQATAPALLFCLAFAIRCLPWANVLRSERIYLHGNDAYYHMRRIAYTLNDFPARLDFDPYIHFPHGARAIWPPLFDFVAALLVAPFHEPGSPRTAETAAVFIPPLLGAGTVVALFLLARRHFGGAIAWLAGLALCLLPAHFHYSRIGFVDHHAAVALAATLLLAATLDLLTTFSADAPDARRRRRACVAAGLAIALPLLIWPGSLLHVALAELCMLGFVVTRPDVASARRFAGASSVVHAVALATYLLLGGMPQPWEQWGPYSPVVATRFQPWLLSLLMLHAGLCHALWRRAQGETTRAARLTQLLAIGLVLLAASALLLPGLAGGAGDAWQWLARKEAFQAGVRESLPLFRSPAGGFATDVAEMRLSRFLYLFPLALAALLWEARTRERRIPALVLVAWAAPLAAVTVAQRRFFNTFSVLLALVLGWCLVRVYAALAGRLGSTRWARAGAALATALAALVLLAPIQRAYAPLLSAQKRLLGVAVEAEEQPHPWMPLLETASWLSAGTPATSGLYQAEGRPEYGVMGAVGIGHVIEYVGERPSVVDNFGDDLGGENLHWSLRYFATASEQEAARILESLRVRYVVSVRPPAGRRGANEAASMARRLFERDGTGLEHHRMLYESPRVAQSNVPSALKVFERVAGADMLGEAPPGTRVSARIEYRTNRGRRAVHAASTRADDTGRYRLRLPHSSRGAPPSIEPLGPYRIESEGKVIEVEIDERDVIEGRRVIGPRFEAGV